MPEQRICPGCGNAYWLPAAWQHEKCVVVTPVVTEKLVVTPVANMVVNRGKDRHKDKKGRKVYLRDYMRKRRALQIR